MTEDRLQDVTLGMKLRRKEKREIRKGVTEGRNVEYKSKKKRGRKGI